MPTQIPVWTQHATKKRMRLRGVRHLPAPPRRLFKPSRALCSCRLASRDREVVDGEDGFKPDTSEPKWATLQPREKALTPFLRPHNMDKRSFADIGGELDYSRGHSCRRIKSDWLEAAWADGFAWHWRENWPRLYDAAAGSNYHCTRQTS